MAEPSRFVTLEQVLADIPNTVRQTAEEAMILTSSYGRLVAAIVVGKDMTEIIRTAFELQAIGESPGLGSSPYLLMQYDLRAAVHHVRCMLSKGNAVIISITPVEDFNCLSFIPLLPGVESSLLREAIASGSIILSNESEESLSSEEVAQQLGLQAP